MKTMRSIEKYGETSCLCLGSELRFFKIDLSISRPSNSSAKNKGPTEIYLNSIKPSVKSSGTEELESDRQHKQSHVNQANHKLI